MPKILAVDTRHLAHANYLVWNHGPFAQSQKLSTCTAAARKRATADSDRRKAEASKNPPWVRALVPLLPRTWSWHLHAMWPIACGS
jgi:hypothetical protein